jgi:hypothetical protein
MITLLPIKGQIPDDRSAQLRLPGTRVGRSDDPLIESRVTTMEQDHLQLRVITSGASRCCQRPS